MAVTLNASTTVGFAMSSDTSGAISFQKNGTTTAGIDASSNFQFNSGYGSSATAYGCRAWVNFNGTAKTGTYSRTLTTVTVTITGHGLTTGMVANLSFTSGTATSGSYTVTVTGANTFTVTDTASGSTSGNVTMNLYIRASGNVSSVTDGGVGVYTVNLTTTMPDVNYTVVGTVGNLASPDSNTWSLKIDGTMTTSAVPLKTTYSSASATNVADYVVVCVSIFR